jgi:DNA-binding NarL/FixJ family response regulator
MEYKTNDDRLICELSKEGLPIETIAEKMEVSIAEVLMTLHKYTVPFGYKCKKKLIIESLLQSGMPTKQIIKLTEFTDSQIRDIKKRLGLSKPTPRSDKSFAERYRMVVDLIRDGMTVTEACRNVRLSSRDYVRLKALV